MVTLLNCMLSITIGTNLDLSLEVAVLSDGIAAAFPSSSTSREVLTLRNGMLSITIGNNLDQSLEVAVLSDGIFGNTLW